MTTSAFSFAPSWRWLGWILALIANELATEAGSRTLAIIFGG